MIKHASSEMAFPLRWPVGQPRTEPLRRRPGGFKKTFARAQEDMLHELKLLGACYVVVSSNIQARRADGLLYADPPNPQDPGVALYFSIGEAPHCIACDRWSYARSNLVAIALTIEALRGIQRWGSTDLMNRAFAGFHRELPPASNVPPPPDWREVFGVPADAPVSTMPEIVLDYVQRKHKTLAFNHHPDRGGNPEDMVRLNQAFEAAERELSRET